jgi:tripartite-type tricarboxylate transporter receptor subunit TctC
MQRRTVLNWGAAAWAAQAVQASANSGPITFYVGFSAGSPVDVLARRVAEGVGKQLSRTVIVENKPGASGVLAMSALQQAPANGLHYVITPTTLLTLYPHTYTKLPYNSADFSAVAPICEFDAAVAVSAKHPASRMSEFLPWARSLGRPVTCGVVALGSPPHLLALLLSAHEKFPLEPIVYRGVPQMTQDLVQGSPDMAISLHLSFSELSRAGRLRVLASSGAQRGSLLPDVPTFQEARISMPEIYEWFGVFGRAGAPHSALADVAGAVTVTVRDRETKTAIESLGMRALTRDTTWATEQMRREASSWGDLVQRTGFKPLS